MGAIKNIASHNTLIVLGYHWSRIKICDIVNILSVRKRILSAYLAKREHPRVTLYDDRISNISFEKALDNYTIIYFSS